jgi:hypothetical protein
VTVRARKGYWALTRQDAARATTPPKSGPPKAVESALAAISVPSRGRPVRTWIGARQGANGKTMMTFVWEPSPRVPGDRSAAQAVRVVLTAVGADGAPIYRGRVPDAAAAPAGPSAALPSRVSFEAPPGTMRLRLSVEGAGAEVLDSETREVAVPDLTVPQTVFGTPEVFRARTVRDFQALQADARAVPTVMREFARTDRVLVRVPVYAPGASAPPVTARLLNRAGDAMMDLAVLAAQTDVPPSLELPLSRLSPGEYIVEIAASGPGGEVKELLGFRVG